MRAASAQVRAHPDVIVVGSGFGGSVMAARLAERGLAVQVLERGPWWGPGGQGLDAELRRPFPRGVRGMARLVRGIRYSRGRRTLDILIRPDGLWEGHWFDRMFCAVSNGVGGGSLVYTNMMVRPEPAYFDRFPSEISAETLAGAYDLVRAMLRPRPVEHAALKTGAFERAVRAAGRPEVDYPELAIAFGDDPEHPEPIRNAAGVRQWTSTDTTTCILGCNDMSHSTMDLTYLPYAKRHGAEIHPLCEAVAIGRSDDGYAVRYVDHRTGSSHLSTASRVVLAAGTLNTLGLLLLARDRDRTLPALPTSLGRHFSANGDMLLWIHRAADPLESGRGPSATACYTVKERGEHRHLVAEIGLPLDAVPLPNRAKRYLSRSAVLFGMGRDAIEGTAGAQGAGIGLPVGPQDDPGFFFSLHRELRAVGAGYRPRGMYTLGASHGQVRWLFSVHPLGGASIAVTPTAGVVDHTGQVFGHPGLFVADGSILPAAPGVPPSMTIAALAEYESAFVADGVG